MNKIIHSSVKNTQKFCINCKYYVLRNVYDNYDNSIICETSNCSKFVTKKIVSGEIKEELAIKCRNNEKLCGINAKYFISKNGSDTNDNITSRTITDDQIIINNNNNVCIECKYSAPNVSNDPFEERVPIDYNYRCNKFVTTDIISGKEENKLAIVCRNSENLCGINARFFIKK